VLNDVPGARQTPSVTEPQRDRGTAGVATAVDEVFGNNVTSLLCGGSKPPPYKDVAKLRGALLSSYKKQKIRGARIFYL